jgi:hypothetical protein
MKNALCRSLWNPYRGSGRSCNLVPGVPLRGTPGYPLEPLRRGRAGTGRLLFRRRVLERKTLWAGAPPYVRFQIDRHAVAARTEPRPPGGMLPGGDFGRGAGGAPPHPPCGHLLSRGWRRIRCRPARALCRDNSKYRRRQFEVPVEGTGESVRGKLATHFQQAGCDDSGRAGPALGEVVVGGDVVGCGGVEGRDEREDGAEVSQGVADAKRGDGEALVANASRSVWGGLGGGGETPGGTPRLQAETLFERLQREYPGNSLDERHGPTSRMARSRAAIADPRVLMAHTTLPLAGAASHASAG